MVNKIEGPLYMAQLLNDAKLVLLLVSLLTTFLAGLCFIQNYKAKKETK